MFQLFRKTKQSGVEAKLSIQGMHCSSCALNIDDELEEVTGVFSSSTKYATATTVIRYDAAQVSLQELKQKISDLGYQVSDTH